MDSLRRLDDRVLLAVNSFARHTPWLHAPLKAYAAYGVVLFAVLLLAGLVVARGREDRALAAAGWAPIGMLAAVALNQPLGHLVGERRPYDVHHGLLVLATRTTDVSFPSDHSVMAGAATAGLFLVAKRLGWISLVLALLMAFARVYIAAHYPWDVVGGLAFGAAVSLAGWLLLRVPLIALTRWLRARPGLRSVFAHRPVPA